MIWKTIGKIFSKDIPRLVTKDIPKLVTKDIPRIVTKDIPRIVTKDIPGLAKPETYAPELPGLRAEAAKLDAAIAEGRQKFLALKPRLAEVRQQYEALSEDFDKQHGKNAAEKRFPNLKYATWNAADGAVGKTMQDVENVLRGALGFISFDLGNAFWAPAEAKKERDFLRQRLRKSRPLDSKLRAANQEIQDAIQTFQQAIAELRKDCPQQSIAQIRAQRNQANLQQAAANADISTARRMLAAGASPEEVRFITNLDLAAIQALHSSQSVTSE
ncbi:MAG: hypothetical protein M0R33_21455 [Methylomonas sp.]|jgi:hypothetical protein|uniref:hypothetical protein n=1 Tax=Methylomonas sp. TaxID=418 RepID=UPI0025EBD910|nr:hypothetical protein [Methylomonas sp.]MCK9609012.1 hypothetical protein [Methylomonas sp.]